MQAKDIPERPILELLASPGVCGHIGATFYDFPGEIPTPYSLYRALPVGTPLKVARAKIAAMMRRGLVNGCCCGCRGDVTITPKGRAALDGLNANT